MSLTMGVPFRARARSTAHPALTILPLLLASLTTGPFASPPAAGAATPGRHVLRGDLVQVCNVIGNVSIVAAPDDKTTSGGVVVEVTTQGADGSKLRVEVGNCLGAKRLRVVYPSNRIVDPSLGRGDRHESTTGGCCGTGRISFRRPGDGLDASADIVIRVPRGQSLKVEQAAGRIEANDVRADLDLETGSGDLAIVGVIGVVGIDSGSGTISIDKSKGALSVDAGSGGVEVRDFVGTLEVDAGSGGISVTRVRSDAVAIGCGSGTVTGDDVITGLLTVDNGSGGIEFRRLHSREITFDTGSGGVFADLNGSPKTMRIDTGSGGVRLTTPADLDARLEITCAKRRLDLDLPVVASRMSDTRFEGKAGAGTGLIVIESGSGSVSLRPRTE